MLVLAIETTCDETAAAVVADGRLVLSSVVRTQVDLHAKYGGVVPEIASRAHLEVLNAVVQQALDQARVQAPQIQAVAVAHGPGLIGCLLVGVSAAKGFAFSWGVPLVAVNHVEAHLYAVNLLDPPAPATVAPPQFPALGLVISGGHTSLYHMHGFNALQRIGATTDDAVGEAFDKVAAILQLGHPGGPRVEALAKQGDSRACQFPVPLLQKDSLDFSFSGLKTAVLYQVNGSKGRQRDARALSSHERADVAASFQSAAIEVLATKCKRAATRWPVRSIIVGGGVSANGALRAALRGAAAELGLPLYFPPLPYCTDNAAMIAGLACVQLEAGDVADLSLTAVATM